MTAHIGCAKYRGSGPGRKMIGGTQRYCKNCPWKDNIEECQACITSMDLELLYSRRDKLAKFFAEKELADNLAATGNGDQNGDKQQGAPVQDYTETSPVTEPDKSGFSMETAQEQEGAVA